MTSNPASDRRSRRTTLMKWSLLTRRPIVVHLRRRCEMLSNENDKQVAFQTASTTAPTAQGQAPAQPMQPIFGFLDPQDRGRPMSNEELNRRYQEHKRKHST